MSTRSTGPALLLASALVSVGCGRGRDCTKLADVTNRRGAEIAAIEHRASQTPQTLATDMNALADVAEHVVDDVEALELDDETLKTRAREYGEVAQSLSEASRSYATLMETLDAERQARNDAQSAFEHSGQGLLDACAVASESCNAVGDVLRAQPSTPEPSRLGAVLNAYVKSLEALDLEEGPVSNAVSARVAAAKAYRAIVTRQTTLDTDIESARGRIHEIVDKQNALIDQLNVFCVAEQTE